MQVYDERTARLHSQFPQDVPSGPQLRRLVAYWVGASQAAMERHNVVAATVQELRAFLTSLTSGVDYEPLGTVLALAPSDAPIQLLSAVQKHNRPLIVRVLAGAGRLAGRLLGLTGGLPTPDDTDTVVCLSTPVRTHPLTPSVLPYTYFDSALPTTVGAHEDAPLVHATLLRHHGWRAVPGPCPYAARPAAGPPARAAALARVCAAADAAASERAWCTTAASQLRRAPMDATLRRSYCALLEYAAALAARAAELYGLAVSDTLVGSGVLEEADQAADSGLKAPTAEISALLDRAGRPCTAAAADPATETKIKELEQILGLHD